jgi:DNA-binding CsgD family transcriptional regulator
VGVDLDGIKRVLGIWVQTSEGAMISTRTVESQLSAVYRKLDVRSRGQLAAALRNLSTCAV